MSENLPDLANRKMCILIGQKIPLKPLIYYFLYLLVFANALFYSMSRSANRENQIQRFFIGTEQKYGIVRKNSIIGEVLNLSLPPSTLLVPSSGNTDSGAGKFKYVRWITLHFTSSQLMLQEVASKRYFTFH